MAGKPATAEVTAAPRIKVLRFKGSDMGCFFIGELVLMTGIPKDQDASFLSAKIIWRPDKLPLGHI
jgi:hypothetical protein